MSQKTITVVYPIPDGAPQALAAMAGMTIPGTIKHSVGSSGATQGKSIINPVWGTLPNGYRAGGIGGSSLIEGADNRKGGANPTVDAIRTLSECGLWSEAHGAAYLNPAFSVLTPGQFVQAANNKDSAAYKAVERFKAAFDVVKD